MQLYIKTFSIDMCITVLLKSSNSITNHSNECFNLFRINQLTFYMIVCVLMHVPVEDVPHGRWEITIWVKVIPFQISDDILQSRVPLDQVDGCARGCVHYKVLAQKKQWPKANRHQHANKLLHMSTSVVHLGMAKLLNLSPQILGEMEITS